MNQIKQKRENFNDYIKTAVKSPIDVLFSGIEKNIILHGDVYPKFPPIFILGAPRSGTTLLLQLITRRFRTCFFTNFIDRFHRSPVIAGKIASIFDGCNPKDSFSSFYGRTKSWKDPYDGTKIWSRWFSYEPVYTEEGELRGRDLKEIRNTIGYLEKFYNCPFVNKAQRNNGRILEINRIFPDAIFIYMKRDLIEMIQSIYNGFNILKKKNLWFSMKPSNWRDIKTNDLLEHICEEVFFTEIDINRDLKKIGFERSYLTDYSDVCDRPASVLAEFSRFYSNRAKGKKLEIRNKVPNQFIKSKSLHCTDMEIEKIKEKLFSLKKHLSKNS